MMLDTQGREGVFAFLQAQGYTGTLEQWWDEVLRQSYGSEIRIFELVWLNAPPIRDFPEAQAFVRRLLRIAAPHFDVARTIDYRGTSTGISLSCAGARRQEHTQRPLRLDGLGIDIEERRSCLDVRCRLYVNGDFRRDRYFTFEQPCKKKDPAQ